MTEIGFIGDVHGRMDQLVEVVTLAIPRVSRLVFLGDYVNRGPDSKSVLDYLINLSQSFQCTFLLGHHDEAFRDAVFADGLDRFLRMGGAATISSYIEHPYGNIAAQLRSAIPEAHLGFLSGLAPRLRTDAYVAAHAQDFLEPEPEPSTWNPFRILGHVPQTRAVPTVTDTAALIDTGCGTTATGRLTCFFWPSLTWIQSCPASCVV